MVSSAEDDSVIGIRQSSHRQKTITLIGRRQPSHRQNALASSAGEKNFCGERNRSERQDAIAFSAGGNGLFGRTPPPHRQEAVILSAGAGEEAGDPRFDCAALPYVSQLFSGFRFGEDPAGADV